MRALAITLLLCGCRVFPGVNPGTILSGETIDIILCAAQDEKLSLPARDVAAAEAYLDDLLDRIEAGDPEATREAADLVARVQECLQ